MNAGETEAVALKKQVEDLSTALETLRNEHTKVLHKNSILSGRLSKQGPKFAQQIRYLKSENERLKARNAEPSQPQLSPARRAFNTLLDVKAKGWREARMKPEFKAFVEAEKEATTGRRFVDILADADAALNSDVVARIYQRFFQKTDVPLLTEHPAPRTRHGQEVPRNPGSPGSEHGDYPILLAR